MKIVTVFEEIAGDVSTRVEIAKAELTQKLDIWEDNLVDLADHIVKNGLTDASKGVAAFNAEEQEIVVDFRNMIATKNQKIKDELVALNAARLNEAEKASGSKPADASPSESAPLTP